MRYGQTLRGTELHEYRISVYGLKDKPITKYDPELNALVWYSDSGGDPVAIAFAGNRKKPDIFTRYRSTERRAEHIESWLAGLRERASDSKARRATRSNGHTLENGAILYSSWGYDQTNIDFYQVVKIVGKCTVQIRPIASATDHSETGATYVVAVPDSFTGEPFTKRASVDNCISLNSYSGASPWDGKPKYETAFGFGH
jgi:hypothetical protein